MTGRLTGKVAFVAGAGSAAEGVSNGMACAVQYAREGARIFAVDRDEAALQVTIDALGDEGLGGAAHIADMTQEAEVEGAVARCVNELGGVDVLHNNIGTATPGGPVETSEEDWDRVIAINLTTAFLACKYALPTMIKQGSGAIINISSVASLIYGGQAYLNYAGSKAALDQMTQAVALENAAHGVRCNAILPGLLATPFAFSAPSVVAATAKTIDPNETIESDLVPLGHFGSPWDIADAAVFLASDDAGFITGTSLVVDGGMVNTITATHPAARASA
ncbi:MAG: SDR family oxidoreductase [Roseitalea sp.]|jgi:NAD(P)-dependent dehydrogenase (short-subunit alcohol dehydrogenase family)|nr:SDR family oxidoreductase [Roseitalea sp.]MBO6720805.1 SDR family oxidoreductase [Roseitalea sp.]MBO6743952.1 SDR family oxidoreductase [Roseitalea sp.]